MIAVTAAEPPPLPDEALLRRFDMPGPRYTSYPTADRFVEAFDADAMRVALAKRAQGFGVGGPLPLSLYVHIPFCESLCHYCACNKVVTRHRERGAEYLRAIDDEVQLLAETLGTGQPATQLHLGGGTPTFLSDAELQQLLDTLRRAWQLDGCREMSIEVDPRTVTPARLAAVRQMGFNRISFGVQDFDGAVQIAVHRVQPAPLVRELMSSARELAFASINVDLIYGLPKQTPRSFARTLHTVGELRPDRIALYGYAHLPERFKPQRRIATQDLPSPAQRVAMLGAAIAAFREQGYAYIGMDHFALPHDELAVAQRHGRLHRNFQGYTTHADGDLIGLGVSAIGRLGATYYQNAKSLDEYHDALRQRRLPVVRGIALQRDDLVRRAVIMALMCQGRVEFESIELAYLVDMREYFAAELQALSSLVDSGLVQFEDAALQVTPLGWYLVRAIAMVFDRPLQGDLQRARFSRIL